MRLEQGILFVVVVGLALGGPGSADELGSGGPNSGSQYPIAPHGAPFGPSGPYPLNNSDATLELPQQPFLTPYPMNYFDEAAQSLGVKNEHIEMFLVRPVREDSLAPAISGGIDHKGAVVNLRWHFGQ